MAEVASAPALRRRPSMIRDTEEAAGQETAATPVAAPSGSRGPCLLAVDIKTAPDLELLPETEEIEETGGALPKAMYHRVIAIGFVRATIVPGERNERLVVEECRAGGRVEATEPELLAGFWRSFETWRPKLV